MSQTTKWWYAKNKEDHYDIGEGDCVLATTQKLVLKHGFKSKGTEKYNACLMATSPQLLEALQWALRFVRLPDGVDAEEFSRRYVEAKTIISTIQEVDS